jgi:hypothetical protein
LQWFRKNNRRWSGTGIVKEKPVKYRQAAKTDDLSTKLSTLVEKHRKRASINFLSPCKKRANQILSFQQTLVDKKMHALVENLFYRGMIYISPR